MYSGGSEAITFNPDQNTQVMLTPDKKTGVYVVNAAVKSGGPLGAAPEMLPVGTPDTVPLAKKYLEGFQRDKSGLGDEARVLSDMPVAALGFSAREWGKTQVPGAPGSIKLGPAAPGPGYRPVGKDSTVNKYTGFTITTQQQQAATAKVRSDEAAALVDYREAERASLNPLAKPQGVLGVNINADLKTVDNAISKVVAPKTITPLPKKASTTTAAKADTRKNPEPAKSTPVKPKATPNVNASTGFTLPKTTGVVGTGLKAK